MSLSNDAIMMCLLLLVAALPACIAQIHQEPVPTDPVQAELYKRHDSTSLDEEYYDMEMQKRSSNRATSKFLVPDCPYAQRILDQAFVPHGSPPYGQENNVQPISTWWFTPPLTGPSTLDADGYMALIAAIKDACAAGNLSPPTLFRLGFHSQWVAAAVGRSYGGNGGFLQFPNEYNSPSNAGLVEDIVFLLQLRSQRFPGITYADLFTLAGSIAPEIAGGPPIAWYPGRLDTSAPGPFNPPLSVALPSGMLNGQGVQTAHESIMGMTVRETVIFLGGGHTFGGANASGWNGVWTGSDSWPQPGNKYYVDLVNEDWVLVVNQPSGKPQYVRAQDAFAPITPNTIFRTPADFALREAKVFSRWAQYYAKNLDAFTRDIQRTYQRAMQMGAGYMYQLKPTVFHWRGFHSNFDGYGTDISPMTDTYDITAPLHDVSSTTTVDVPDATTDSTSAAYSVPT